MTKKPRVPEVLWRLFRNRARPLSETIISLLPPLPDAASLLRPDDPSDYRDLLSRCFAVVSENAPLLPRLSAPHESQQLWSQHQIVARTIEMIISEQSASSNVICSGYDKCSQSSPLMELLTSPAWCLLLERVGEGIMAYLLKHMLIFMLLDHKNYHQLMGTPINKLRFGTLKDTSKSQCPSSLLISSGPKRKSNIYDNIVPVSKRRHVAGSFNSDGTSSSFTCFSSHHRDKQCQMSLSDMSLEIKGNLVINHKDNSSSEVQKNSNQSRPKLGKRSRPFGWERHRKRRQLNSEEKAVTTSFTSIPTHKSRLPEKCHLKDYEEFMCWMRQNSRKVTKGAQISRKLLFYNLQCSSSVFPRKHILNSLKPNTSDSMFLLERIFGLSDAMQFSNTVPSLKYNGFCVPGSASACLYHSLIKYLKILIRRTRSCQHLRFLNKHCVVPTLHHNSTGYSECSYKGSEFENQILKKSQDNINNQSKTSLEATHSEAIKSYCLKSQVVSFIWAVCRSIVPADLLGTQTNWRILRRNISKFIRLRRFEHCSLKQCMHKLKTSAFPFLSYGHSLCCLSNQVVEHAEGHGLETSGVIELKEATHTMKQRLLESWIYWFFSYVVVPLVQSNFYVTESECGKRDVFYYRKSVWEMMKKKATTCLKDQNYVYLDNAEARDIVSCREFGFSKLRLLPKENGIRLLANLKASSRMLWKESHGKHEFSRTHKRMDSAKKSVDFRYFRSVNSVLRDTHAVLKGMQLKEPEKLGSSVFDYNDIYKRLCPFLVGLKRESSTMPAVFMIVSDVSKAFDSVDQKKLLSVMEDIIREKSYTLKQYCQVYCTKKSMSVRENLALLDQNINSRNTSFTPCHSPDSILVNQECSKSMKKEELLFHMNEHVKRNVLQLDKKFYLQRVGISQGSVVSTLLCSLYYGDMERKVIFPFLERTRQCTVHDVSSKVTSSVDYMLLRFIDDFLFISTSKQQAENFFSRLLRGFRDYNCYMNEGKFGVNFDIGRISELSSNRLSVDEDGTSFLRWSGLLINCSTLEVQADYTKYLSGHLCSSLTVCWQGKPARHLEAKLCGYMRPKCHPVFYDSNINSAGVVRLNIFQAFLLCAMKFHCYFSDLSYVCEFQTRSYLRIIEKSLRYMHFLIKKRMCSASLGFDLHPVLHLEDAEVEWLGLNAYIQALTRKQSRHKELLSVLRSKLSAHNLSANESTHLTYAVDPSHSSLMWKIKY